MLTDYKNPYDVVGKYVTEKHTIFHLIERIEPDAPRNRRVAVVIMKNEKVNPNTTVGSVVDLKFRFYNGKFYSYF